MHRNHQLRNQLVSTLNPDSMYHVAFKHDVQKNPRIQYQDKSQEESMKIKTQTTIEDKGKFLSLVSKQKKGVKKGQSNKKTLLKKSHSVILGGTKQSKNQTNQSERSFQRSRCKSCINLHQTNENTTPKSQTQIIQTPKNNILTKKHIPLNTITQPNENNLQLTKIISHKLKMDTIQPHQFFTQRISLIDNRGREMNLSNNGMGGFDRRGGLLRNVSAGSVDRVYFTVGNNDFGGDRNEESIESRRKKLNLRVEKPLLTPRFDNTQEKGQRKRRQRAGFIRSASARKASPIKYDYENTPSPLIQPYNQAITTAFSPVYQQQPKQSTTTINPQKLTAKQQQIDQCITKMSLIRKQIDQIQSMIHQRLQSSQIRTKFIMNGSQQQSIMSNKNSSNNIKQQQNQRSSQLYTHRVDRDQNNINDRGIKNSRLQLNESRSATTIVNDLNNLSRSLLSMSKCALMESGSKIQQLSNIMVNNNNTNSISMSSNGNSRYDSCYNNNFNNNNNNRNYLSQKLMGQQQQQRLHHSQQHFQQKCNIEGGGNNNNLLNLNEICKLIKQPHANTHMNMYDNYNNIHHQHNHNHNQLLTQQLIEKQYVGGGRYVNNNNVGSKVINNTNTNNYNSNTNNNLNPNPNTIMNNNNNKCNQENIITGNINYPIVNNQQRNVFINRIR